MKLFFAVFVTVQFMAFQQAVGETESLVARSDAVNSLQQRLTNFRIEGTGQMIQSIGDGQSRSKKFISRINAVRFEDYYCFRYQVATQVFTDSTSAGSEPFANDRVENREESRHGNSSRHSKVFGIQPECWPFCESANAPEGLVDCIPDPSDFTHRAPWGRTVLGELLGEIDFISGFTVADLLAVSPDSPFKVVSERKIDPEKLRIELESDEFGRVTADIELKTTGWELTRLTRAAVAGQSIGRAKDGRLIKVDDNVYFKFDTTQGLENYKVSYDISITPSSIEISKSSDHYAGERRFESNGHFKSQFASFGNETPERIVDFTSPLPEGRSVSAYEPDRRSINWIVRNGLVVMDKGPLTDLSQVRHQTNLSARIAFFGMTLLLIAIGLFAFAKRPKSRGEQ
jgi:hypothetical protein